MKTIASALICAAASFLPSIACAQMIMVVDRSYRADLTVCEVSSPTRADLIVYVTDRDWQADGNEGVWKYVDRDYRADFKVMFVDREYRADLRVYFTDRRTGAGWRDTRKKHLLEK